MKLDSYCFFFQYIRILLLLIGKYGSECTARDAYNLYTIIPNNFVKQSIMCYKHLYNNILR